MHQVSVREYVLARAQIAAAAGNATLSGGNFFELHPKLAHLVRALRIKPSKLRLGAIASKRARICKSSFKTARDRHSARPVTAALAEIPPRSTLSKQARPAMPSGKKAAARDPDALHERADPRRCSLPPGFSRNYRISSAEWRKKGRWRRGRRGMRHEDARGGGRIGRVGGRGSGARSASCESKWLTARSKCPE